MTFSDLVSFSSVSIYHRAISLVQLTRLRVTYIAILFLKITVDSLLKPKNIGVNVFVRKGFRVDHYFEIIIRSLPVSFW